MNDRIRLGFIGFGNMAQALAQGLINAGAIPPDRVYACAKRRDKLEAATRALGVRACADAAATVDAADMVVIAVKPHLVADVIAPVRERLRDKIVVSVAAGYDFVRYETLLTPGTPHLSVMPNTPVAVGEGVILCESRHSLSDEAYAAVRGLFSRIALVEEVDAGLMGIGCAVCGCGPAFACLFLEALADAAVKHGLPREAAYRLAGRTLAGTARLQAAGNTHPAVLKDAVCSPGGLTIAGVAALEHKGLRSAVIAAVDAVMELKKG